MWGKAYPSGPLRDDSEESAERKLWKNYTTACHSVGMHKFASFLLLAPLALPAQTLPIPQRLRVGYDSISQDRMRADLTFFAGDGTQGRMTLSPGDLAATEWVASEFAKAGLKAPATDASGKPTFMQAVPVIEYAVDTKATEIRFEQGGKAQTWHSPQVGGGYREAIKIDAPLAYVGYGITAPEYSYDDYAGVDVHGKIVLLMEYEPQEDDPKSVFNGTGLTRHGTLRTKMLNAQRHGAVAVIVMPEPNSTHPSTAMRSASVVAGVKGKRLTPIPLQQLEGDELHIPLMTVPVEVADKMVSASMSASTSELQRGIDTDLKPRSRDLSGSTIHLRTKNLLNRPDTTYNAVGLMEGSDPKLRAETVMVSGHHDHNGVSEVEYPDGTRKTEVWNGADDNGSGAVGVVALAQAFARNPIKPKRSILFVVFASEERGFEGSNYLTQHPLRDLKTTRAMVNFDMIGRDEKPSPQTDGVIEIPADTTNRLNLIGSLYSPDLQKIVEREDKRVGLVLDGRFDRDTTLGLFYRSDQLPFVLHGVPAIWFFTGFHPDYHHSTDTVEKIDFVKMQKIVRLGYLTLFDVGDALTGLPQLKAGAADPAY